MSVDTSYKLIYFPVKALAEPIRLLFSYGDIKFEDARLGKEQWQSMKEATPFGQVPLLEIDNKIAHQSIAICRYLGNVVNLAGNNAIENLEIDSIVDTITEFRGRISAFNKENSDSERKTELYNAILSETLPFYMERFNTIANTGFLALGKLTWADIYFVGILDYCNGVMKLDCIAAYKNLVNVRKRVLEIPSIKRWIDTRPPSEY